jgi:hypothetical protein
MPLDESSPDTVLPSLAFTAVDSLLVLCYLQASPTDADWDVWIAREKRMEHRGLLIWTDGGSPNARQRARVAAETDAGAQLRPPVALLTDSMAIRAIMTAFAWLLGSAQPMKAFPRAACDEAVMWLRVPAPPALVRSAVLRLNAALELVQKQGPASKAARGKNGR